nr:hypothetical protein [Tanacetum cinerariifolium]
GIFCKRCTCKSCGKDAHIGYNCPSTVPVISNPKPCNSQTIDELPQTLPIFHSTFHYKVESPFTLDPTPTYVDESPNVFNPPPQPSIYPCEFCGNDAYYGHYCTHQAPFIYPEPCYNQDFNFPQNFQTVPQKYPCCDDFGVTHDAYQCQPMNEVYACGQNSCYDSTSIEVMEIVIPEVGGIKASNDNPIPFYDPIISRTPPNLTPSGESDFFLEVDAFLAVEDEFPSSQFPKSYLDPEGDILLFEAFLNDDHSSDFKTKSSSTSLNSLLEETHTFDNSLPEFTTFSKVLFDSKYEEIIPMESLCTYDSSLPISSKIDSLLDEFAGELTLLKSIPPGIDETDYDFEEDIHLIEKLLYDNSSPRIKDKDYDSERDILIPKDLPSNNTLSFAEKESFHFDIPPFSRPPAKPPDGDTEILNIKMMGDIYDQKAFMHKLMITLASHQENSPDLLSHRCGTVKKFNTHHDIIEERAAKAKYWKLLVCYDDDDDDDEERFDSLDDNIISRLPLFSAITPNEPVLSTEEPDNSLSMGDEHLDTIPTTESDEFIKSGVETLILIPSESPNICVLFDSKYESDSSDDQSCSEEDVLEKSIVSANSDAKIKSFSPSPILVKDSDFLIEEIDLFCTPDYPMLSGIKDKDYDSERDILIPKDLPSNNTLSFAEKKSVHFDIPLFSRPPTKPPDGDTGILNIKMIGDIYDQKAFMHKLMITLASHQEKSPDLLSHRCRTVKKFNTHRSHLNKCLMTVSKVSNTEDTIKFMLDTEEFTYTVDMFRVTLYFPVETLKNPFLAPVNIQTIEAFMNRVGYQGVVDKVTSFYLKNLAQPWQTMFKEICATDDFKEYETMFVGVDVPMNQPKSTRKKVDRVLHKILPQLAERATNDLIENKLKPSIVATIIEDRDAFRLEVHDLVSQEFNAQAPKIIEELFKNYVQSNVIQVYPTTTTSTETTSSSNLQQQLYLKMKRSLEDQANDPIL